MFNIPPTVKVIIETGPLLRVSSHRPGELGDRTQDPLEQGEPQLFLHFCKKTMVNVFVKG